MKTVDEVLETAAQILLRCTIMGIIVLLVWWAALALFGDLAYTVHTWAFPMPRQQFDTIHYTGMLLTKAAVTLLFLFPYISIILVIRKRKKTSLIQKTEDGGE